MNRMTMWLATCLVAVVTAGCGTVTASSTSSPAGQASSPAAGGPPTTQAVATQSQAPRAATATTTPRPVCPRPADDTLTLASNGKTYCVQVGARLDVYLRGTLSRPWLEPLASSDALVPVPNGAMSLPAGLTGESFAAARAGQVLITSVRAPCRAVYKNEAEPSGSVPRVYPLGFCPFPGRFSVSIVVLG